MQINKSEVSNKLETKRDIQAENIDKANEFLFMILDKVYPTFNNFPRAEKNGICRFIKEKMFQCSGNLNIAKLIVSKRIPELQRAQAGIEEIRNLMYFSKRRKYISNGFWEDLNLDFDELRSLVLLCFRK